MGVSGGDSFNFGVCYTSGAVCFVAGKKSSWQFTIPTVVQRELSARQASATYGQARSPNARMSALQIGQGVRALIKDRWLSGAVRSVCSEPESYVIQLDDGRLFRRTRWAVNTDRSSQLG